jgi:hypothetical protein
VELTNSGNVRLQAGAVTGMGAATTVGCDFGVLQPGGRFICQVTQLVSQTDLDATDADASHAVSVGVSATVTPMGSNNSDITHGDAESLVLAPAIRHGLSVDTTTASPTTVTEAGRCCMLQHVCTAGAALCTLTSSGRTPTFDAQSAHLCLLLALRLSCMLSIALIRWQGVT